MDALDIDEPIQLVPKQSGLDTISEPSAEQVGMLCDMGFTMLQAKKALRETVRDSGRSCRSF